MQKSQGIWNANFREQAFGLRCTRKAKNKVFTKQHDERPGSVLPPGM